MNQIEWLKLLQKETKQQVMALPQNSFGYKQFGVPLERAAGRIFARYKLPGELFFDFEIQGDGHKVMPDDKDFYKIKMEKDKLTAFLSIMDIDYITARSGRGIHVHIFTNIKNERLEKVFYKWIVSQAMLDKSPYLDSKTMLSYSRETRLRCMGSKHLTEIAFKSTGDNLIQNFEQVTYPEKIVVYTPPKSVLKKLYKIFEAEKKEQEYKASTKKNITLLDCNLMNYGIHNKLPEGGRGYIFSKNLMALGPNSDQVNEYCVRQEDSEINPNSVEGWKDYDFNCYEMQKWAVDYGMYDKICEKCPLKKDVTMNELKKAEELSKDPYLLWKIKSELDKDIVGEDRLKLTVVLTVASLKCVDKIGLLVTGESSSGKTRVVKKTLSLFPQDNIFDYTRVTKRALDYIENENLDDKLLYIGEGAGAEDALETIKMMTEQADGERKFLTLGEDENGNKTTRIVKTKGNPAFITTSAKLIEDQEFTNRLLTVGADLSEKQTNGIIKYYLQKAKSKKYMPKDKEFRKTIELMYKLLLKRVEVEIPYAEALEPLFTGLSYKTRMRRDAQKFLTLIKASAALHQAQRIMYQENDQIIVVANPQDFWNAFILGSKFLARTLYNIHETTMKVSSIINESKDKLFKDYEAKESGEVIHVQGFTRSDFDELRKIDLAESTSRNHLNRLCSLGLLKKIKPARENIYLEGDTTEANNVAFGENAMSLLPELEKEWQNGLRSFNGDNEVEYRKIFSEDNNIQYLPQNIGNSFYFYLNCLTGIVRTKKDIDSEVLQARNELRSKTTSIIEKEAKQTSESSKATLTGSVHKKGESILDYNNEEQEGEEKND